MRKNLYLDSALVDAAQAEADRREDSLSDFVELALREKLRRLAARPVTAGEAVELDQPQEVQS